MNSILYNVAYFLGYVLIGIVWSFIRWKNYVDEELAFYETERQRFLNAHRIRADQIPEYLKFEWKERIRNTERLRKIPPRSQDFRFVIAFDVICWPITFCIVLVQQFYTVIVKRLLIEYNKITITRIEKIRKDLN